MLAPTKDRLPLPDAGLDGAGVVDVVEVALVVVWVVALVVGLAVVGVVVGEAVDVVVGDVVVLVVVLEGVLVLELVVVVELVLVLEEDVVVRNVLGVVVLVLLVVLVVLVVELDELMGLTLTWAPRAVALALLSVSAATSVIVVVSSIMRTPSDRLHGAAVTCTAAATSRRSAETTLDNMLQCLIQKKRKGVTGKSWRERERGSV